MEIAYTAHTETCTLLLDAEGICRSVLAVSSRVASNGGARPTRIPASAEKCVGAQYVATIDLREAGGMTALPQPGAQMLFARTEKNGRISLIRSARVIRFEAAPAKSESGVHDRRAVSYGDDEELTIPCDPPTLVGRQSQRPSLPPPPAPVRNSGVVPAGTARRTPIPPPPRSPRIEDPPDSLTRPRHVARATLTPPAPPRRPSLASLSACGSSTDWEVETRPFKRAAR